RLPLTDRQPRSSSRLRSSPSSRRVVDVTVADRLCRPSTASQMLLLPLPDSPTSPTTSPGPMSNETPRTASTEPDGPAYVTRRSATCRTDGSEGVRVGSVTSRIDEVQEVRVDPTGAQPGGVDGAQLHPLGQRQLRV